MKRLIVIAFLIINVFVGYAQSEDSISIKTRGQSYVQIIDSTQEGKGTLSGTVTDRKTGEPIPFANVVLLFENKVVTGAQTDFDGNYTVRFILPGTYTIQISCIGYATSQIQEIVIGANKKVLQDVTLQPNLETLDVIEIIDYKVPIYESDIFIISEVAAASEIKEKKSTRISAGLLTSGEVNDFAKWNLWGGILKNEFNQYANILGFNPIHRYIAQLTNKRGMPVVNAHVTLKNSDGDILWQAKTDNTGKAELWHNFFKSDVEIKSKNLQLIFEYEGKTAEISNVTPFEKGINTAQIDVGCNERNKVDIFFMIDATGSMSDEIRYLQAELDDIIQKVHKQQSELQLRTGCMVYRDHGDEYLTRKSSLNSNINETLDFLRAQSASGGGDYPEAVDIALYHSITNEDWDDDALARILFIVLDAPSHTQPEVLARLESQLRLTAKKGIRIVPIACSDIKKDGEYLMRTFALATNGTYLFLTDDSGIGNAHIKPSTDQYDVEKLNDAIVRIIKQYTLMPDCNNPQWAEQSKNANPEDKFVPNPYDEEIKKEKEKLTVSDVIKVFPNPCSNILKIEVKKSDVKDIYIVDMTGKTLYGFNAPSRNTLELDVNRLSSGVYFVKVFYNGRWFSEKFVKI